MSAVSVYARSNAAWILADTARFNNAGQVTGYSDKVGVSSRLRMAIGFCGRFRPNATEFISGWLSAHPSQSMALGRLPDLLTSLIEREDGNLDMPGRHGEKGKRLCVGWYDEDSKAGRVGIVTDCDDLAPDVTPFSFVEIDNLTSPTIGDGQWPDRSFDPASEAARLAKLQRHERDEHGIYRVGVSFERYRIHAGGIDREAICNWPDRTGLRISPNGGLLARMRARSGLSWSR